MNAVKKIAVISASPKMGEKSASEWMALRAETTLNDKGIEIRHINVRNSMAKKQTDEDFTYMARADALLIIFPLYIFCTPGVLTRFLQDYAAFVQTQPDNENKAAVYTVVNCGFPEPDINREAVRVIKSFSDKVGARFRFGILIGMGGMILGPQNAPFMKTAMAKLDKAVALIKNELLTGSRDAVNDVEIKINFPRFLYFFGGNRGWISTSKKNRLSKKDMYARPYV